MIVYHPGEIINVEINCQEHGPLVITSKPLKNETVIEGVECPFCLNLYPVELEFKKPELPEYIYPKLSARTRNALRRAYGAGISVGELLQKSEKELSYIRNIGVASLREIREALAPYRKSAPPEIESKEEAKDERK